MNLRPVSYTHLVEATATANGTITDLDGNFTLSVPANSTLKITYIAVSYTHLDVYKRQV